MDKRTLFVLNHLSGTTAPPKTLPTFVLRDLTNGIPKETYEFPKIIPLKNRPSTLYLYQLDTLIYLTFEDLFHILSPEPVVVENPSPLPTPIIDHKAILIHELLSYNISTGEGKILTNPYDIAYRAVKSNSIQIDGMDEILLEEELYQLQNTKKPLFQKLFKRRKGD